MRRCELLSEPQARRLLDRIPARLRARGERYQAQDRVRILEHTSERVVSHVRGTSVYRVVLSRGDGDRLPSCTCPAYEPPGACKHVAALLLEIARRGSPAFGGSGPTWTCAAADGPLRLPAPVRAPLPETPKRPSDAWSRLSAIAPIRSRAPARARPLAHATAVRRPLRYVLSTAWSSSTFAGERLSTDVLCGIEAARDGEPLLWRPLARFPAPHELDAVDRVAVELLRAAATSAGGGSGGRGWEPAFALPRERRLGPGLQAALLPWLAREDRLWFRGDQHTPPFRLAFDEGDRFEFALKLDSEAPTIVVRGVLQRRDRVTSGREDCPPCPEACVLLEQTAAVLGGGFVVHDSRLLAVDWHGAQRWAAELRESSGVRIDESEREELAAWIAGAPPELPVHAPGMFVEAGGAPRAVLSLQSPEGRSSLLRARLEFLYGTERVPRGAACVFPSGSRVLHVRRDREAEARAETELVGAGARLPPLEDDDAVAELPHRILGRVVRNLTERGWLVEAARTPLRPSGSISISVSSGIDWFDLRARLVFGAASAALPALLRALERRSPMVLLDDGSLGLLPEEWLARWEILKDLGTASGEALRVPRGSGLLLDALLPETNDGPGDNGDTGDTECNGTVELEIDAAFAALRGRLAATRDPRPLDEPEGFVGTLRPYQREGLGWLAFLGEAGLGGCLADDMGLGKTVQVLALVLRRRASARGPALVVAPRSLLHNWETEARRFTPTLRVVAHHGPQRAARARELADVDLLVTTYGTWMRDAAWLGRLEFDLAVLDEAQTIRNAKTRTANAARSVRAAQRVALSGTPIENRFADLLSIFEFTNPGLVTESRALGKLGRRSDPTELARWTSRALRPLLMRRTKSDVQPDLPLRTEQRLDCDLEGQQRREYERLRDHYRSEIAARLGAGVGPDGAGLLVLQALLRLRQAACHLALLDPDHEHTRSAKMSVLLERLAELRAAGHKSLVFSQFASFLALVRRALDARGLGCELLDGSTHDRERRIGRFRTDPQVGVFLISLKAGGVGLNLTEADYVFLLDPWWNPAAEQQAIDRAHRIGQTRPVTAFRLVARGTVEEKVLALQERKRALAQAIFAGSAGGLAAFTRGELEELLA